RVAEVREHNWREDMVTTTSYNEHGDMSESRITRRSNNVYPPPWAFTIKEDGTLTRFDRPPEREWSSQNICDYRYQYDQHGNWTERTTVFYHVINGRSEAGEPSPARRTLTYF